MPRTGAATLPQRRRIGYAGVRLEGNDVRRVYKQDAKHKRRSSGEGPPRWFPDADSLCPDDMDAVLCQQLLDDAVEGKDLAHPSSRALYAVYQGAFFKAYAERVDAIDGVELWHGYPVDRSRVPTQVPARILRELVDRGQLTKAEYKKLLGSAR